MNYGIHSRSAQPPGFLRSAAHAIVLPFLVLWLVLLTAPPSSAQDAYGIVDAAVRYYRGKSSVCVIDMKIARPGWSREMSIRAWTKGQKDSLFTIIAPPKDEGNGTLKKGREMSTYNPKVNRVIKLPPSMMSQSWMGSDFSNEDLAKSDSIVDEYTHSLEGTEVHEGKTVYVIRCTPKPGAAVVWGAQRLKIREDRILLLEEFYDEDGKLVKALAGSDIRQMGGKLFPKVWTMRKGTEGTEFTVVTYRDIRFDVDIPDYFFRESSLKSAWR